MRATATDEQELVLLPSTRRAMSEAEEEQLLEALAALLLDWQQPSAASALLPNPQ